MPQPSKPSSGLLLALLAPLACTPLGRVPSSLVDLHDGAAKDGVIHLALERDGSILAMRATLPLADLPIAVRDAALALAPGAHIEGAARELRPEGPALVVQLRHENRDWEFVIDAGGRLLETKKQLSREEVPAAVLTAAERAIGGGAIDRIALIERGASRLFRAEKTVAGGHFAVFLEASGKVTRRVRESLAGIEIPLKK